MTAAPDPREELDALRRRLDAAESVLAIQGLKARYGDLVDSRFARGRVVDETELLAIGGGIADLFTPDGVWDGGPGLGVSVGRSEIAARLASPTVSFARHWFVQPAITVDGDRASARWQLLSPCVTSSGEARWVCGYEDDKYVRTPDGAWLFGRMAFTTVFAAPAGTDWGRFFA
ncbi:MAG: nuclear transport factor 2 family protein [Acidimicrobiales bacterium]